MTDDRLTVLRDDLATIDNIDRQLVLYQEDMRRQFAYHLTRVENIIARMIQRGDEFFEETIRIGRIFDLLNTDKIRGEFERKVVGDTEAEIDQTIDELIDWMVEQDLRIWEERQRLHRPPPPEPVRRGNDRRGRRPVPLRPPPPAGNRVPSGPRKKSTATTAEAQANELADSVRNAVATVAVAEAGAVGLGALVVAAASTVAVDVTGILAASLLAGLGLFVLPNKRRQARRDFHLKADELERRVLQVMREQFEHELARSVGRIKEAIAPYTRFVRSQYDHMELMRTELNKADTDMRALRHQIGEERAPLKPGVRATVLPPKPEIMLPRGLPPLIDEDTIIDAEHVRVLELDDGLDDLDREIPEGTRPEDI